MEGLQLLLEGLRGIHGEDKDARERRHCEEMEAQKQAHARMMEMQKAELNALKEAHTEQLKALVAHLPKHSKSCSREYSQFCFVRSNVGAVEGLYCKV